MKVIQYHEQIKESVVLALGYFDALHKGHLKLIEHAKQVAHTLSAKTAVFTFRTSPKEHRKEVFLFEERLEILKSLGIDYVVCADADDVFLSTEADVFIETLRKDIQLKAVVAGEDYTYGKDAKGKIGNLFFHLKFYGIKLFIEELEREKGAKISTGNILSLLNDGMIEEANALLTRAFQIEGVVQGGRRQGRMLGYPTANIEYPPNKVLLKEGVYVSSVIIEQEKYKAVSNIGTHPTFDDVHFNVETFLLDFEGDLYGKKIGIEFYERIRDTVKFSSEQELINQLKKDILTAEKSQRRIG